MSAQGDRDGAQETTRRDVLRGVASITGAGLASGTASGNTYDDTEQKDFQYPEDDTQVWDEEEGGLDKDLIGEDKWDLSKEDREYIEDATTTAGLQDELTYEDARRFQAARRMGVESDEIGRYFNDTETQFAAAGSTQDTRDFADVALGISPKAVTSYEEEERRLGIALNTGMRIEDEEALNSFADEENLDRLVSTVQNKSFDDVNHSEASWIDDDNIPQRGWSEPVKAASYAAEQAEQLQTIADRYDRVVYNNTRDEIDRVETEWDIDLVTRLYGFRAENKKDVGEDPSLANMYDHWPEINLRKIYDDIDEDGEEELKHDQIGNERDVVDPEEGLFNVDKLTNAMLHTLQAANTGRTTKEGVEVTINSHDVKAPLTAVDGQFPDAGQTVRPVTSSDPDIDDNDSFKITEEDDGTRVVKPKDKFPLHDGRPDKGGFSTSGNDDSSDEDENSNDDGNNDGYGGEEGGDGTK